MNNRKLSNDELGRITPEEYKNANKNHIIIVLDNIRSSYNIGSVFRSADAFFVEQIYLCGICSVPPSAEIHKSALGAEFSVEWIYFKETSEAIAKLRSNGFEIISIEQAENSVSLEKTVLSKEKKYALVFGNEVKGVQQEIVSTSDQVWEIPQYGTKHSLNISVSAGVVLWECHKKLNRISKQTL
jgi:23S rRNA (guanosine2251-2'-O)-methyltransferase